MGSIKPVVLVTGGSGLVGRPVCRKLVQLGMDVVSVSLDSEKIKGCTSLSGDITDKAVLERIFDAYPFSKVIHLAAILVSASRQDPEKATRVNVLGSLNLLELCVDSGVDRFIYGSSLSVLGDQTESVEPITELSPMQPIDFYGETKRFVEHLGRVMADKHSFKFIVARLPLVVGPGAPSLTSSYRMDMFNLLNEAGEIDIPYTPDQILPLAHSHDVAEAIAGLLTAESLRFSVYHLPHEAWRISDLCEEIESIGDGLSVKCGDRDFVASHLKIGWERFRQEISIEGPSLRRRLLRHKQSQAE